MSDKGYTIRIPLFRVFMAKSIMKPLRSVLYSGFVAQGPKVDELEMKIGKFLHVPYVASVNSGTTALHLALDLIGVKPGDEVITTAMTCTATNWPILAHGAKLVWADIDPDTGLIHPDSIAKRITKRTKAIMAVDWGGYPVDIDVIKDVAGSIPVIEDAAQAFGSEYKDRMVGETADFTCLSFQAIKHLTTVDGGAVITRSNADFERVKLLRYFGIDRTKRPKKDYRIEDDIHEWGYKMHMNDVNATIGLENLKHTERIIAVQRDNAAYYNRELSGLKRVWLVRELSYAKSSYWLYTMKVDDPISFMHFMKSHGVMASQVHRRNDNHPVTREFVRSLPGVDEFSRHMCCLPVGWWVTKKDRSYIVDLVRQYDSASVK